MRKLAIRRHWRSAVGMSVYAPSIYIFIVAILGVIHYWISDSSYESEQHEIYAYYGSYDFLSGTLWLTSLIIVGTIISHRYAGKINWKSSLPKKYEFSALTAVNSATLLVLVFYYFEPLLSRDRYIEITGTPGIVLTSALMTLPVSIALERGKLFRALHLFIILAICFSLATRSGAIIPIMYGLTRMMAGFTPTKRQWALYTSVALSMFSLALACRELTSHGLLPYISELIKSPSRIALGYSMVGANIASNYLNFVATLAEPSDKFDFDYLVVTFNPLSGEAAGWNEISSLYRIHFFVPYSGMAELLNMNKLLGLIVFGSSNILYSRSITRAFNSSGVSKYAYAAATLAALMFFALLFSYNARSCIRWLYLGIGINGALVVYLKLRSYLSRRGARRVASGPVVHQMESKP